MEEIALLRDKRIVLGVTGGISAYKVCSLASHLTQVGANVDVVMTEASLRFVGPLTFQSLTGRPVYTDLWTAAENAGSSTHVVHISLAHAADLLVIAPATANTLAKAAQGLADNLLSTIVLAARCPILMVPAMDVGMWRSSATETNVNTLRSRGVHFAGPERGRMASGLEGEGRMVEPDEIMGWIRVVLAQDGPLAGRRVVVSAGPTRESIDPVRFISNPSSGRQGFALAQAALDCGADVQLIAGPSTLETPIGASRTNVQTAQQMCDAVLDSLNNAELLIMAAAVGDYQPARAAAHKIKKQEGDLHLRLIRTPDILSRVSERREQTGRPSVVVGFAAETESLLANAQAKLSVKHLDMIVANDVIAPESGFETETNRVVIVRPSVEPKWLPVMSKASVAEKVLAQAVDILVSKERARRL